VYVFGASFFMVVAYYSDKVQMRSPFIVLGLTLNLIGESSTPHHTDIKVSSC